MENLPRFRPNSDCKLMDQVRETMRYIRYYGNNTHPAKLDAADIERFLSAPIFLYHKVLNIRIDDRIAPVR